MRNLIRGEPRWREGLGELGNVGTAFAVTNAVYHATGQRIRTPAGPAGEFLS